MTVSEIARLVGIAPSAVRFYERRGVLPQARRHANGYREYGESDVSRLRLVVTLRRLGISPEYAGRLVAAVHDGRADVVLGDLVPFVSAQREAIRQRLTDLRLLDATLLDLEATARSTARHHGRAPRTSHFGEPAPVRVLFVCTGNSARSQLAEAVIGKLGDARYVAASAGTRPRSVHPLTIQVLAEIGIDWRSARSKPLADVAGRRYDYVVTVCDRARRACPTFPGEPRSIHWGLSDPARARGSNEERLQAFRRALAEITTRLEVFVQLA
jgi:protein-tyrosine-phosphatase/DNA-binding transcriptional MerR regulator